MRRVAITGLGAVTPLGNDVPSTWETALAGRSGVDFIQSFDASEFPVPPQTLQVGKRRFAKLVTA